RRFHRLAERVGPRGEAFGCPAAAGLLYRAMNPVNLRRRFTPVLKKCGAGYGDRTRLTGLGSQGITTRLSPRAPGLTNAERAAQAHPIETRIPVRRQPERACSPGATGRQKTRCPAR